MNFIKQTVHHPKRTGAIAPSSKKLSQLILEEAQLESNQVVVELGPGTGVFTEDILAKLPKGSQYIGIEINEDFATHLQNRHPHTTIHHGSAENITEYLSMAGHDQCDRIISGLPWAAFRSYEQKNLLREIYKALSSNGLFLTFSYPPFHHLPRGRAFRKKLENTFSSVKKTDIVFNIPPAFVYICRK